MQINYLNLIQVMLFCSNRKIFCLKEIKYLAYSKKLQFPVLKLFQCFYFNNNVENAQSQKHLISTAIDKFKPFLCLSWKSEQSIIKSIKWQSGVLNKSRCTICSKLGEICHEVSVNNITHKLCSNHCFNEYREANGLIMNCCEQCGEYMPNKNTGNSIFIGGQQKRFCCQSCVNEYKQVILFNEI